MNDKRGRGVGPNWQRQHIVDVLRKTGHPEAADEAFRTLPESVNLDQLLSFSGHNGISRDELVDRMGGSS